ncbi:hypothetical protein LCGC14_1339400, partial [marine sediment metagenome]
MADDVRRLVLAPGERDYAQYLTEYTFLVEEIARHFRQTHGRPLDTGSLGHFGYRMHAELLRWADESPGGDMARHGISPPLTLGKLLDMTWPTLRDDPPPPPDDPTPLPVAPSFTEMENPIGNFLHPAEQYFPPASWVKSEETLRARLQWVKDNGYTVELAMMEQTHWGTAPGRDPRWTQPDTATPLVFDGPRFDVFGWTNALDELIRRITIARREYGIECVVALWDQERIQHDFGVVLGEVDRVVTTLDPHVVAYQNSWEIDEVLTTEQQHRLNNAIGKAADKPCGPHFSPAFKPDADYWAVSDRANLLWHQYDPDLDEA